MPDHLAAYLHDHLAGSTAALELLGHLERAHPDLGPVLAPLRLDIAADRQVLEGLMARHGVSPDTARQAAAWLAEKAARLKMTVDDPAGGALRLLESLEAVAVGIHGKWSLWRALAAAGVPAPPGSDYDRLAARAEEQRQRVEGARLDAARAALGS